MNLKSPRVGDVAKYFLKLGVTGFGGPVALVAAMQRDLVDSKKWYTQDDFRRGMVLAQLSPGPMASQMAMFFGWLTGGWWGGLLAGVCLALPAFLIVLGLSYLYITYSGFSWLQMAFRGAGPVILALIVRGAFKLWRSNTKQDPWLWGISILSAFITYWTQHESLWLFLGCGSAYSFLMSRDRSTHFFAGQAPLLIAGASGIAFTGSQLGELFGYFLKVGSTVFGSGLTIVPFLHSGVVKDYQWVTEQQFLDAVAIAMITPGPIVITVAFIGFMAAGVVGASLAAIGTFLPVYFFTVIPAPYFDRWTKISWLRNFVTGLTAAAVGATLGAAALIASATLVNLVGLGLTLSTLVLLWKIKKVPEPLLILAAGFLGLAFGFLGVRI